MLKMVLGFVATLGKQKLGSDVIVLFILFRFTSLVQLPNLLSSSLHVQPVPTRLAATAVCGSGSPWRSRDNGSRPALRSSDPYLSIFWGPETMGGIC